MKHFVDWVRALACVFECVWCHFMWCALLEGHWHDPDMLLIGNECITLDEEKTQMAIWCVVAAPLIMGYALRNISAASKSVILNERAIAISQVRP
jgi:hypothetical protein